MAIRALAVEGEDEIPSVPSASLTNSLADKPI